MIIYTDLYNRTKNYTLTAEMIHSVERQCNVKVTTDLNPNAEVYWGDKITLHHLSAMPDLKWLHLSKTGVGKFILPDNILVTNTPDSSNGVAEFAVAGVLHLLRALDRMPVNRLEFDKNIDYIKPFSQVSCLVVGCGRIGKEVCRLLSALGMKVKCLDRHTHINEHLRLPYDFIINALPLTCETKDYFTAETFVKMNKSSYIINVGRGETINENDLFNALKTKQIRGAFLDVVQDEPIKHENSLLKLDNVVISPHIANALNNMLLTQVQVFIKQLTRYKQRNDKSNS